MELTNEEELAESFAFLAAAVLTLTSTALASSIYIVALVYRTFNVTVQLNNAGEFWFEVPFIFIAVGGAVWILALGIRRYVRALQEHEAGAPVQGP